jgi:hypothetical protein
VTTLEFLRALFDRAPGQVSLWDGHTKLSSHGVNIGGVSTPIVGLGDVYFGVGTRRPGLPAEKRGGKADIVALPGLFVDLDLADGRAHKTKTPLPADRTEAAALIAAVGKDPTLVVDSGFGLHVYWLFDKPFVVGVDGTVAEYEAALSALQQTIIKAAAAVGQHVDNTAEAARVLRLPGTLNVKVPGDARTVEVLIADGPRYPFAAFGRASGPVAAATAPTAATAATAPTIPIDDVRDRLGRLRDLTKRAMATRILAGQSYADTERDRMMNLMAATVAWLAPDNDPADLATIFEPSHAAWAAEPTATKSLAEEQNKVTDKIRRSQTDARAERARLAAEDEAIKNILGYVQAPEVTTPIAPAPEGQYTTDELEAAAAAARCTVAELKKRWVIQVKESFYILTDKFAGRWAYADPQPTRALRCVYDWLRRAPIEWRKVERKAMVLKSTDEIVTEYGSVGQRTEASLCLASSYYDETEGVFHEAACPPRPLRAVNHADIDAWLRVLGGDNADKLLDWIATVTDLTTPSAALYLTGPPETGKSLLANGLARLWTTGTPTEMSRVLGGNFNDDLTKCPLVFADEALPQNWHGKQTSADLRRIVTENRRTLARKHLSNSSLEGCIRIIMAANNDNLLAFNEDMSPEDIQAMAERFLHIDTAGAVGFLKTVPLVGWVTENRIAEHALHLRDTRQVTYDGRFAVKGEVSRIHRSIATRGTVKGLVVEWLARYLVNPSPAIPKTVPVRVGGGQYLINTSVVTEFWGQHVQSDKVPTTGVVSRILKGLSSGRDVRINGVRVHEIDVQGVVEWAKDTGVAEPETLMARVNAPIPVDNEEVKPVEPTKGATVHDLKRILESKTN